jgi:hypothetical protein
MERELRAAEIWACQELREAQLGDERLNLRLARIVATLAEHPDCSLPQAMGEWADLKAAYRFFDNPRCQPEQILAAHRQATLRRIQGRDLILVADDTTQFDFSTHHAVQGMGPTGAKGLQGFFMHSGLGMTADGIPLGLLGCYSWHRPEGDTTARHSGPQSKESQRWPDMLQASTAGIPASTRVLTIADREADFFEFLLTAVLQQQLVLVRANHDRAVLHEQAHLWQTVAAAPPLGPNLPVRIPRADDHPARTAQFVLRAIPVSIPPPAYRSAEHLPAIRVSAILAQEVEPPPDSEPVSWMLLSTLSVATYQQAAQCLIWYTYRWRIERFHYTLKSGCGIEKLQLETAFRIRTALAVYCLVAWRLLYLTYAAREQPEQPCSLFLTQSEWQALYARINRTLILPEQPPDVRTAVRWIAKLGGFLGRKGDGEPGVKVLWRGLRLLQVIVEDWLLFHPDT